MDCQAAPQQKAAHNRGSDGNPVRSEPNHDTLNLAMVPFVPDSHPHAETGESGPARGGSGSLTHIKEPTQPRLGLQTRPAQFMRLSPALATGKVMGFTVQPMGQPSAHR